MFARTLVGCLLAVALSGCITTNTVPITPDSFRLDTDASGLLFTGNAGSDTLLKAAQITKQRGYFYFKIQDGQSAAGTQYGGTTVGVIGHSLFAAPIYSPSQAVSITVQMLPGAEPGAWNVDDVIAKKGKMF